MTYYEDMSEYAYFAAHEPIDPLPRNIGWLSLEVPYESGSTSERFKELLFEFCLDQYIVHVARGFHSCEFCGASGNRSYAEQRSKYDDRAHWASIGDGEIRVIGESRIYAAPALIYHYVVDHGYKPPDDFIDAVTNGPSPGSDEHGKLIQLYRT